MDVSKGIILRQIEEKDCERIVRWNQEKDKDYLVQWAGDRVYRYPLTVKQMVEHSKEKGTKIFSIWKQNEMVGSIELAQIDAAAGSAVVSRFLLSEDCQHQGLGALALRAVTRYGFDSLHLQSLTLGVFCFNAPAIRCYEKCGFRVKEYHEREETKWNYYIMEIKHFLHD